MSRSVEINQFIEEINKHIKAKTVTPAMRDLAEFIYAQLNIQHVDFDKIFGAKVDLDKVYKRVATLAKHFGHRDPEMCSTYATSIRPRTSCSWEAPH